MTFTAIPAAGAKLRGSVLNSLITEVRPVPAFKAATTSRNTTASPTADPDLVLALVASAVYDFEFVLGLSSAADAAGDFQSQFSYPADATVTVMSWGLTTALASGSVGDMEAVGRMLDAATPTTAINIGCSTTVTGYLIKGRITTVTAGNLTLLWAQQASNGNNTNLLGGSYAVARRLS